MEQRHLFLSFLAKILDMPIWVKEILYIELKKNLEDSALVLDEKGNIDKDHLYQYYVPTLTYAGKKELANRVESLPENVYKFLEYAQAGANILQITINNFWTLEEAAAINVNCLEKQFVSPPVSLVAKTMLVYLSGRIRLGEYFKRLGRIDAIQLENALRRQKELDSQGQRMRIAEIMINMGYITEDESKLVLHIKDECKKRFMLTPDLTEKHITGAIMGERHVGSAMANSSAVDTELATKLTKENTRLKNKLDAIGRILSGE